MNRLVIFLITISLPLSAFGYVASSSNYRLEKDSINFGGTRSQSGSFNLEDTLGEVATGEGGSLSYLISAGYQAMETDGISIGINLSSPADINLSSINGKSGGVADGNMAWSVVTNNPSGYSLAIQSATNPALSSGANSFNDYAPAGVDPDLTWSTPANQSYFGFTPEGDDVIARYLDNGSSCGVGSLDTVNACWDGFSTTPKTISSAGSSNNPTGTVTTVKIRAEIGSSKDQSTGSYSSTIIATALAL